MASASLAVFVFAAAGADARGCSSFKVGSASVSKVSASGASCAEAKRVITRWAKHGRHRNSGGYRFVYDTAHFPGMWLASYYGDGGQRILLFKFRRT